MIAIGLTALVAAPLAAATETGSGWLWTWVGEGLVAAAIAGLTIRRRPGASRFRWPSGPARKFALAFLPPSSRARC